jgi:hypothetical protein
VLGFIKPLSPFPDKLTPVALCPWTPYGRPLPYVKHAELYARGVSNKCRLPSKGVNLSYYLALGNASDGWVARHLGNLVHVHRYQQSAGTHVCGGTGCLATSVACTNYYYVIAKRHVLFQILCTKLHIHF